MKSFCPTFVLILIQVFLLCGCLPVVGLNGLSNREVRGNDLSTLVYDGLPISAADAKSTATQPVLPLHLAVVQAGEVSPPQAMLDMLRADRSQFASVESLPGIYDATGNLTFRIVNGGSTQPVIGNAQDHGANCRLAVNRMRALAVETGADYVLLYGGTMDHNGGDTPLAVFNLTIIGLYLVPSYELSVDARAAGVLLDARTGRVVMTVSADASESCLTPNAAISTAESGILNAALNKVAIELVKTLQRQLSSSPLQPNHPTGG